MKKLILFAIFLAFISNASAMSNYYFMHEFPVYASLNYPDSIDVSIKIQPRVITLTRLDISIEGDSSCSAVKITGLETRDPTERNGWYTEVNDNTVTFKGKLHCTPKDVSSPATTCVFDDGLPEAKFRITADKNQTKECNVIFNFRRGTRDSTDIQTLMKVKVNPKVEEGQIKSSKIVTVKNRNWHIDWESVNQSEGDSTLTQMVGITSVSESIILPDRDFKTLEITNALKVDIGEVKNVKATPDYSNMVKTNRKLETSFENLSANEEINITYDYSSMNFTSAITTLPPNRTTDYNDLIFEAKKADLNCSEEGENIENTGKACCEGLSACYDNVCAATCPCENENCVDTFSIDATCNTTTNFCSKCIKENNQIQNGLECCGGLEACRDNICRSVCSIAVCGNTEKEKSEECDFSAESTGCTTGYECSNSCECIPEIIIPEGTIRLDNNVKTQIGNCNQNKDEGAVNSGCIEIKAVNIEGNTFSLEVTDNENCSNETSNCVVEYKLLKQNDILPVRNNNIIIDSIAGDTVFVKITEIEDTTALTDTPLDYKWVIGGVIALIGVFGVFYYYKKTELA
ncbi:MAG: hypothetical protein KAS30_03615 [Candidatus Diapherotrites archaeon]|nr:hypothetical protein [Candidatus Diapherotrites archaeon]